MDMQCQDVRNPESRMLFGKRVIVTRQQPAIQRLIEFTDPKDVEPVKDSCV